MTSLQDSSPLKIQTEPVPVYDETESPGAAPPPPIIVRVSIPNHGLQKALRCPVTDTVWSLKKQLLEKVSNDIPNGLNYGLFMIASGTKQGRFLDEKRELSNFKLENNAQLEFLPKMRLFPGSTDTTDPNSEATRKKNKKVVEDVSKGFVEKVKEKGKTLDPNFWIDEEGSETLLTLAVMNDDKDMIVNLCEMGAHPDYRLGNIAQWKTPLHIAAQHNKPKALQALLALGAWSNCVDGMGLTPLYYAATGGHKECVHRLLIARAATEVYDENGKGPLHQACLNNHDQVVWLLIDYGAQMNVKNVSGNTPLHVAATRNSLECVKYLLLRGADKNLINKAKQTPVQVAMISNCNEICDLINKHTDEDIIPPPPLPTNYNDAGELRFASHTRQASHSYEAVSPGNVIAQKKKSRLGLEHRFSSTFSIQDTDTTISDRSPSSRHDSLLPPATPGKQGGSETPPQMPTSTPTVPPLTAENIIEFLKTNVKRMSGSGDKDADNVVDQVGQYIMELNQKLLRAEEEKRMMQERLSSQ